MHIWEGGVGTAMASEKCYLMNVPATGGEVCEPKVTKGMGGKLLNIRALGNALYHLGPGPDRDRLPTVAPGLRNKHWATRPTEVSSLLEVGHIECSGVL